MFDSLKKKFGSWFKKSEEEEPVKEEKKVEEAPAIKKTKKTASKKPVKETKKDSQKKKTIEKKEEEKLPPKKSTKKETSVKEKSISKEKLVEEIKEEPTPPEKEEIISQPEEEKEEPVKEEKKGFFAKVKESFSLQKEVAKVQPKTEETPKEQPTKVEESVKEKPEVKKDSPEESVKEKEEETPKEHLKEKVSKKESEEPKEHLKEEVSDEEHEEGFFAKIKKRLTTSELTQDNFDEAFYELELTLLENNVALEVVDKIKEVLGKELVGKSVKKSEADKKILDSLKKAILSVLIEPEDLIKKIKEHNGTFVILFFGINGSGKTTSIAKLAHKLKKEGFSCILAAGDTFRAASIEQLETHAKAIDVPIVKGEYGKDPSAVAFDAIAYAKKHKIKVVLIDTAGRMYTRSNLMKEMEKIVKVSSADLKVFVGESITGNDATQQAKMFNETAGIDGIILTKADVDEKAGAILSVSHVTGKPILFLGVGQNYEDLKAFKKEDVLDGLGLS